MDKSKKRVLILPKIQQLDSMIENSNLDDDYIFTNIKYSSIEFIFEGKDITILCDGENILEFDYVWLNSIWSTKDTSYAISLYLAAHKIPHTTIEPGSSKLTDHMNFALNGINTPKTYFKRQKNNEYDANKIADVLNFPIVIKNIKGSLGKDIFLVNNKSELENTIKELDSNIVFIFQEFIENNFDWGTIVSNNKIVAAERSYAEEGEFKNNLACGAKEVFCDLEQVPDEITTMALAAMRSLNLNWGRPDIVIQKDTKKPYLLEVNRRPGITYGSPEVNAGMNHIIKILEETV